MAASQASGVPSSVGVASALESEAVDAGVSGLQPDTQPPATQDAQEDVNAGVQGVVKQWGTAGSEQASAAGSLAQTAASSAVRSSISEVAEFAKQKKKAQTVYLCADCMEETRLGASDPVRCQACGNRILYKRRGNAPVQYEAK